MPKVEKQTQHYRCLVGMNVPTAVGERRLEVGDVTNSIPASSVEWLLEDGYIEPCDPEGGE